MSEAIRKLNPNELAALDERWFGEDSRPRFTPQQPVQKVLSLLNGVEQTYISVHK